MSEDYTFPNDPNQPKPGDSEWLLEAKRKAREMASEIANWPMNFTCSTDHPCDICGATNSSVEHHQHTHHDWNVWFFNGGASMIENRAASHGYLGKNG